MLMRMRERNDEVEIEFKGLGGRQQAVLAALSGDGSLGEPTLDRAKLASLSVHARADAMHVRLRAKSGECLDLAHLYRGLRRALLEGGRRAAQSTAAAE